MKEMDLDMIMPFGKHKGKYVSDVPTQYLLYMYDRNIFFGELKKIVEYNVPVLRILKENNAK